MSATANGNANLNNNLPTWRITVFASAIGLVFLIYLGVLFDLQIREGQDWVALAEENRISEINLPTQRGIILDRNGYILARNIASFNVMITPAELPDDPGEIQEIYRKISELVRVPVNLNEVTPDNPYVPCRSEHGITQIVEYGETTAPYEPVRIECNVDRNTAMVIKERSVDWPGVDIEIESVRDYPTSSLTAATIGFLGPISAAEEQYFLDRNFVPNRDKVGYAGVERYFQSILGGRNGRRLVEVDVAGQILRDIAPPIEPAPGFNLNLTLDTRLQSAAEAILIKEINFWNVYLDTIRSTSGVVIALNPKTGEILAMVSYPSYENHRMAREIPEYYYDQLSQDPRNPLLNHAVGDELPAGSVFKLVTAVGALNEGVVDPEDIIKAPPKITIEDKSLVNELNPRPREFIDWNEAGFGELDFLGGISNSSNIYFYKLGGGYQDEVPEGLGICRLGTYARALGYGDYPGIEMPLVEDGLIPDPTWKRINQGQNWSLGDTYIAGVGQGFVIATPLQVLLSAATIANDGVLVRPTILREIVDSEGNVIKSFLPDPEWDITKDPLIDVIADPNSPGGCESKLTGEKKTVQPWVIEKVQEGMRLAVLEGTLEREFSLSPGLSAAGKTGTAEYCDKYANEKNLCIPGNWPTHAWTVAYAPYDDPEIAVVAFVYNGGEGASVAGPIVRQLLDAYFEIKAGESGGGNP
ncbi:MAG TPA: penicillin-binding protein 2 [Anaerolineales bacterium]|nr:penicillin-binding protein 2 [Anaerolineales bacterium]